MDFIAINKIVQTKGDFNTKDGSPSLAVKKTNILKSDVKEFRAWGKAEDEEVIKGDFTLVSIRCSENGKGESFFNIKINESEESFGKRMGGVIMLNEQGNSK